DTVQRPVSSVRVNPQWRKSKGQGMDEGDIAVVNFQGGLPSGYQSVPMAKSDRALKKGKKTVLAGYGIDNPYARTGSGKLRKTRVSVADPRPGKHEMILDQSHGKGACHGDSGGPAFVGSGRRAVLAGVTNRSYPNGAPDDCHHQVVYTKVSSYRPWIEKSERDMRRRRPRSDLSLASRRGSGRMRARAPKARRMRSPRSARPRHLGRRAHRRPP